MFKSENASKIIFWILLMLCGFFFAQTYLSMKQLEKDVVSIRITLEKLEGSRISRQEIRELISEYHNTHPCVNASQKR